MTLATELAQAIVDPRSYSQREIVDAAFKKIRAEAPLDVAELEGMDPFWVVSRAADIKEVERQADIFHNGDKSTFLSNREGEAKINLLWSPQIMPKRQLERTI